MYGPACPIQKAPSFPKRLFSPPAVLQKKHLQTRHAGSVRTLFSLKGEISSSQMTNLSTFPKGWEETIFEMPDQSL